MRYLLDTHLLLWAAVDSDRLSVAALAFRSDFSVDPDLLRRGLVQAGYEELAVTGVHAVAVRDLPDLHKDPFDRMLLGQARVEGLILVTSDAAVARYPGNVQLV